MNRGVGVVLKEERMDAPSATVFMDSGFRSRPTAAAPLRGNDGEDGGWLHDHTDDSLRSLSVPPRFLGKVVRGFFVGLLRWRRFGSGGLRGSSRIFLRFGCEVR